MYNLRTESSFEAAHSLPCHKGKCKNLHGHRWRVIIDLKTTTLNPGSSMVADFHNVKDILRSETEVLDHKHLNEELVGIVDNPTAENIARYLHERMFAPMGKLIADQAAYSLSVTVEESPGSMVTYDSDEWGVGKRGRQ